MTRVVLTGKRSAFIGPNLTFSTYRPAVATIVVGLSSNVRARLGEGRPIEDDQQPVVILPPGGLCELESSGDVAVLFCDALCDDITEIDLREVVDGLFELRAQLTQGPRSLSPDHYLEQIFAALGVTPKRAVRSDIERVVRAIGLEPERFADVETAAELAGLSPMRFQHLFTETVGMPFRRYRQWRRMGRVVRSLAQGQNLTAAAQVSGFSNSAHLSTAFKAMFGMRPSDLLASRAEFYLAE